MTSRPPVLNWLNDFDHRANEWVNSPSTILAKCRAAGVATSQRYGGLVVPLRYEDIIRAANDPEHLSSCSVVVRETREEGYSNGPINSDPPQHTDERRALMRCLNSRRIAAIHDDCDAFSRTLISTIVDDAVDLATKYAQPIASRAIAKLLGVPLEDAQNFKRWIKMSLDEGAVDAAQAQAAFIEMDNYVDQLLRSKQALPADDIPSQLLADVDAGALPSGEIVKGMIRLLLLAGIDTTWSFLSASLLHIGQNLGDRDHLVSEPNDLPNAIEELLRLYAPVTMARQVVSTTTVASVQVMPGTMVLLPFAAANRDQEAFAEPEVFKLDRKPNRHLAFGFGRHRCVGANLARGLAHIAIRNWLEAFPTYRICPEPAIDWSVGVVRGPRAVWVETKT
jgi:cytochrome P450